MMKVTENISRRDFVKLCGAASLALAAPAILAPLAEAAAGPGRFVDTRLKMGTTVTVTVVTDSSDQAQAAFDAAWREMDRLTAIFDRHRQGTVISELNAAGTIADPGPEMMEVLSRAGMVHRVSGGAFDPTVVPLLTLMEDDFRKNNRPPEDREVAEVCALVDFAKVEYNGSRVRLGIPGQQISLDGVAKGYIVDRTAMAIRSAGIKNALVNAGGDIMAVGFSHRGGPWRVGIQDPSRRESYLKVIALANQSVATSGSYEVFFDKDQKYHHLLNPRDGRPPVALVSSTVVSDTTAMADALATAAFIKPEVLQTSKTDGFLIARNGRQSATKGFRELLVG